MERDTNMKKGTRLVAVAASAALAAASLGMGVAAQAADRTVTIFGGYSASDAAAFQDELNLAFKGQGIKVKFTSLASFDTDITTKIKAGQAPDIAMWPQPGGLLKQKAKLVPLDKVLGSQFAAIKKTLVPGFELLGKASDGKTYGLPVSANLKSIVFYNPAVFKANGWTVPTTQAQLTALQNEIKASGKAFPWCAGTESGGATGWSLTDWMEELVLKTAGVDTYNKWWKGQVKWTDPKIVAAGKQLAATLLADGNTQGGGAGVTSRFFGLASTQGLFKSAKADGACAMLKQGSFITSFFPDDIQAELKAKNYAHVGVFAYPGTANLLGGGDTAGVFHNNPAVAKVAAYIMSDKMGTKGYASKAAGFLSPHKTFDPAYFGDAFQKQFTVMFSKAKGFGFDGSDQAPPQVNKTEWSELTNWFAGKITMDQAFKLIADSYNQ
jgi:alpha-glucoside transport system substrate-binding protein